MRFDDLIRVSARQVWRHRHHYWGVVLAIALGTAGFITVHTMGREVKKNLNQDLDLIGGVTVVRTYFDNQQARRPQWFRPETFEALGRLPGVKRVSLGTIRGALATWRQQQFPLTVVAIDEYFWEVRSFWPLSGGLFDRQAVRQRARVCVVGVALAQKIFGHSQVVGNFIDIDANPYLITGVLDGMADIGMASAAFIPLTTAQDRLSGITLPDRLYVRCETWDNVSGVAAVISGIVQAHQDSERLHVDVSWDLLTRTKRVSSWVESFFYLAITMTLLLGGMGIWNIMMAAVRSRTREIGLKKAMGAENGDILAQFLSEAIFLSLGSALTGVALGWITVAVLGLVIHTRPPTEIFLLAVALGLLFAMLLGVGAGLYPSLQASRMEVVSATRYE